MIRLFIDPSVRSMGIAIWTYNMWKDKQPPNYTALIKSNGNHWITRSFHQIRQLDALIPWKPDLVFCEVPQFYETHRGLTASRSGSIYKLCVFVGMLVEHYGKDRIHLITPGDWKGQLPKELVIKRICRILGSRNCKSYKADIWDAVGMGLWKMGKL